MQNSEAVSPPSDFKIAKATVTNAAVTTKVAYNVGSWSYEFSDNSFSTMHVGAMPLKAAGFYAMAGMQIADAVMQAKNFDKMSDSQKASFILGKTAHINESLLIGTYSAAEAIKFLAPASKLGSYLGSSSWVTVTGGGGIKMSTEVAKWSGITANVGKGVVALNVVALGSNIASAVSLGKRWDKLSEGEKAFEASTTAADTMASVAGIIGWASLALGATGIGAKVGLVLRVASAVITGISQLVKLFSDYALPRKFEGGAGNDELTGNKLSNWMYGHKGDDEMSGGRGDDWMWGGEGKDTMHGGSGNDSLYGEGDDDVLSGGTHDDSLYGGPGDDVLNGGKGRDQLFGQEDNDVVLGLGDVDRLDGGPDNDTLSYALAAGVNIALWYPARYATSEMRGYRIDLQHIRVVVNDGNPVHSGVLADKIFNFENVIGSKFADHISGNDSVNRLYGSQGDDVIHGRGDNDILVGGEGHDRLYGGSGDDVLVGGKGRDHVYGERGNDVIFALGDGDTLDGGADNDTLNYADAGGFDLALWYPTRYSSSFMWGYRIDLQDSRVVFNDGNPLHSGLAVLADTIRNFEHVNGSRFTDHISGDNNANVLKGLGGIDTIYGRGGDDLLVGGEGHDLLYGGRGDDVLVGGEGIDRLHGGRDDDILVGGNGQDELYGERGNDVIFAQGDGDILDGGADNDTLNYADATGVDIALWYPTRYSTSEMRGYRIDLQHSRVVVNDGNPVHLGVLADTIRNFENVIGSKFADHISGDANANVLKGLGGIDTIYGRGGGDLIFALGDGDVLDGGADNDTLNYADATGVDIALWYPTRYSTSEMRGYRIDLQHSRVVVNDGNPVHLGVLADTIRNFENVIGSKFADHISGDANANVLKGLGGIDTIYGRGGGDLIFALGDGDVLDGGADNDTLSYADATGVDIALWYPTRYSTSEMRGYRIDLQHSRVVVNDGNPVHLGVLADTIRNFEHVTGSKFADHMTGDDGINVLRGGLGDDTLSGGGGGDFLYGGADNDTLSGNNGMDLLRGGSGDDILIGGAENDLLYGDEDSDMLFGESGDDRLWGGTGNDKLAGGHDDDTLFGGKGDDILFGGEGDDALHGGAGADILSGDGRHGSDLDTDGAFYLDSDAGVQIDLRKVRGDGYVHGAGGHAEGDRLRGIENLVGSGFADRLLGNHKVNEIYGRDGNDFIKGRRGNDLLSGGAGDDNLSGGRGNDFLSGGTGRNILSGGADNDTFMLSGVRGSFAEADVITDFGAGANRLKFEAGVTDVVWKVVGGDTHVMTTNTDTGEASHQVVLRGYTDGLSANHLAPSSVGASAPKLLHANWIETDASASGFTSTIGTGGNDVLIGHAGAERLSGAWGDDLLVGDGGNDQLHGGVGQDRLIGGAGSDLFEVSEMASSVERADVILDFTRNDNERDGLAIGHDVGHVYFERRDVNKDGDVDTILHNGQGGVFVVLDGYDGDLADAYFYAAPSDFTIQQQDIV